MGVSCRCILLASEIHPALVVDLPLRTAACRKSPVRLHVMGFSPEGVAMDNLYWLLQTDAGLAGIILRLTLATVMFPHGAQKALGWYGGHGFKGTVQYFTGSGIPKALAVLAIAAEFLGPIGLVVGLLTRVAAFGVACVMIIAITTVHSPHGFFMNWDGKQKGEGFEYHLLALGIALALMIAGAGAWSLDAVLVGPR
jgi:putative oxidoreductase